MSDHKVGTINYGHLGYTDTLSEKNMQKLVKFKMQMSELNIAACQV